MDEAAMMLVDQLSTDVSMTPLAMFARLFLENDRLDEAAARMFGDYDEFPPSWTTTRNASIWIV